MVAPNLRYRSRVRSYLSVRCGCVPPFCGTAFTNSLDNVRMIVTFISTTMVAHYGGTQEQTIVLKIQGNHRFAKPDTTTVDNNCPG